MAIPPGGSVLMLPNNGASANRLYAGQLDDFMKFDCQDCIWESRSAAVAELGRSVKNRRS
jgi:hypothetical protein